MTNSERSIITKGEEGPALLFFLVILVLGFCAGYVVGEKKCHEPIPIERMGE